MGSRDRTRIRVLRLCSVFEPPPSALVGKGVKFDPIGGMQNHTAELTRALDRRGVVQTVVTTRPPTAPHLQLSLEELRVVRDYEERTKRRDTLLEQLDSKIGGGL